MHLRDRTKIDVWSDPVGIGRQSTAVRYTPWYDMQNYQSIDFVVQSMFEGTTYGTTSAQYSDFQIYKATDSSGGGSTAISSATGRMTKAGTAITTAAKAKALMLTFDQSLSDGNLGATVSLLGQDFLTADVGGSAAGAFCGLASVAATVVAKSFCSVFNTHTSCTAWKAELGETSTGRAVVYIRPKSETAVAASVYVSAGGSTLIPVGVPQMGGHLGITTDLLRDGYRYVALGIAQSASGLTTGQPCKPVSVTVLRERAADGPVASTGSDVQFSMSYRATNASS